MEPGFVFFLLALKKGMRHILLLKRTGAGLHHRRRPLKSCRAIPITPQGRLAGRCITIPGIRRIPMMTGLMTISGPLNGMDRIGKNQWRCRSRPIRSTAKPIPPQPQTALFIFSPGEEREPGGMTYGSAAVTKEGIRRQNVFPGLSIRILSNTIPMLHPRKVF